MLARTRIRCTIAGLSLALLAAACSSADNNAAVTVTAQVTVGPSGGGSADGNGKPAPDGTSTSGSGSGESDSAGSGSASSAVTSSGTTGSVGTTESEPATESSVGEAGTGSSTGEPSTSAPAPTASYDQPKDGVALPDGFVPHKLKDGEKPPQFVVVSFDGVGWDEKWQYWFDIATKVPFRFTGFLSGTYMLTDETKDAYTGPGRNPGESDINWNTAADLPVEITDLNHALETGDEIGTHFNGHFCTSTGQPGGNTWVSDDWNTELDQFFALVKNYRANNTGADLPKLELTGAEVHGERTPCLEGHEEDLFPALQQHHINYDSSFTKRGISWPKQSPQYKIWQIGMAEYPMHGTLPDGRSQHVQITMDYNFWYSQRQGQDASPAEAKQDSQQVLDTYRDMYSDTFNGNRAPLILGNHFNQWNHNAYSDAIGNFVLETCGKADTQCVPFQDLIAWMQVQDPAKLAELQNLPPELGQPAE